MDSLHEPTSTAADHRLEDAETASTVRRLNDGREFRIVKVFYEPRDLARRLEGFGWRFTVSPTENYFLYGCGSLRHANDSATQA